MEEFPVNNRVEENPSLWKFIKKAWKFLTGSVLSSVVYSSALISIPFFLGHIIDAYKDRVNPITSGGDFLNSPEFYWTLAIGAGSITFQCIYSLRNYFIKRAAIEVQTHTLPDILERAVDLTYTENQNLKKGEIEQSLNELQNNLESFFSSVIQGGSSSLELLLAMTVVAIKFEYEFSIYLAGISLFNVGTLVAIKRLTKNLDDSKRNADKTLSSTVHDIVANYENIKVSGKESYVVESFGKPSLAVWSSHQKRGNACAESFSMCKDALLASFATYVIARAVFLLSTTPDRSIDDITYIVIYLRLIIASSSIFDSHIKRGMTSYRTLSSIVDILNKDVESRPAMRALDPDIDYPGIHQIFFNDVKYRFDKVEIGDNWVMVDEHSVDENKPLLEGIEASQKNNTLGPLNFELNRGTFTGVAGDSGSGKTVITRLLFRFLNLHAKDGSITLGLSNGTCIDIQALPLKAFRHQISYTPQNIGLFDGDLMKNITLDDAEKVDKEAYDDALQMAQLSQKEKAATAEDVKKFSGGQRQRIALARAFYQYKLGCKIFIFDESTSALDATLQSAIMREIYALRDNGCMVFFIAHRLSTIRRADQILFLSKESIGNEERSYMEVQRTEAELSAFDAMRKKSKKFNKLAVAEFGEDLNINPGSHSSSLFANKAFSAVKKPVLITLPSGEKFERLAVKGDGDCGFTAFGITRKYAHELLQKNLNHLRNILIPLMEEVLCTDENFINYLTDDFREVKNIYVLYRQSLEHNDKPSEVEYERILKQYAQDLNLLSSYIDFDVREKRVDAGWAHPLVLFALAELQKVPIRLWELNERGDVISHRYYGEYHPQGVQAAITDLLFVNGNHYERLQKIIPAVEEQPLFDTELFFPLDSTTSLNH